VTSSFRTRRVTRLRYCAALKKTDAAPRPNFGISSLNSAVREDARLIQVKVRFVTR
jgi:hypothetical protein